MTTVGQLNPLKGKRKSYLLHINEDLWAELNEWAALEFRSLNGQIEFLLQRAVNERKKRRRKDIEEDNAL